MKNAVLLAGGRGSRLAPLTDTTPKPLMPFFDKTVTEYLLFRLAACGIRNCLISVGYLADSIREAIGYEYAGINVRYLCESTPLGTAGGVSFARDYLALEENEDFLVLSGDCLVDFDFSLGEKEHVLHHAEATIFTTQSFSPCEYGIVLSDSDRRVIGFNEKPCWSQVNGNRINTGVYILNTRVLSRIPHQSFDFSRDLFPLLIRDKTLYEYPADGYWCDIGSPESYYFCCFDVLNGKLHSVHPENSFSLEELTRRGITAAEPFFVSRDAVVAHGCHIGPNVIVGKHCFLGENSRIENSILHPNCRVEVGGRVEKSILCRNATVRKGCRLSEKILAEGGVLKDGNSQNGIISPSVFPFLTKPRFIQDANGDYILGSAHSLPSIETENFGKAVSSAVGGKGKIGLQYEGSENVPLYAVFLASGLQRGGSCFADFGGGFATLSRFLAVTLHFDCFLFVYAENGDVKARLFNRNGLCPSHEFERKLHAALQHSEIDSTERCKKAPVFPDCTALYKGALTLNFCAYLENPIEKHGFSLAFRSDTTAFFPEEELFRQTFCALSGSIISEQQAEHDEKPILSYSRKSGFEFVCGQARYGFYDMLNAVLQKECRLGHTEFCLSDRWPSFPFESLYDTVVHRYPEESVRRYAFPNRLSAAQLCFRDEVLLCARTVSLLFGEQKSVSELFSSGVSIAFSERRYSVADEKEKMRAVEAFARRRNTDAVMPPDEYEGIRIEYPYGSATVIPERAQYLRVLTQANSFEAADSLCECFEQELRQTVPNARQAE